MLGANTSIFANITYQSLHYLPEHDNSLTVIINELKTILRYDCDDKKLYENLINKLAETENQNNALLQFLPNYITSCYLIFCNHKLVNLKIKDYDINLSTTYNDKSIFANLVMHFVINKLNNFVQESENKDKQQYLLVRDTELAKIKRTHIKDTISWFNNNFLTVNKLDKILYQEALQHLGSLERLLVLEVHNRNASTGSSEPLVASLQKTIENIYFTFARNNLLNLIWDNRSNSKDNFLYLLLSWQQILRNDKTNQTTESNETVTNFEQCIANLTMLVSPEEYYLKFFAPNSNTPTTQTSDSSDDSLFTTAPPIINTAIHTPPANKQPSTANEASTRVTNKALS